MIMDNKLGQSIHRWSSRVPARSALQLSVNKGNRFIPHVNGGRTHLTIIGEPATTTKSSVVWRLKDGKGNWEWGKGRRGKLILSIVHSIDYLRTVGLAAIGFRTTAFYMIWEMRVQQLISDGTIWDSRVLFFLQINATLSTHFCSASIFQQSAPLSYFHGNSDRNSHFYDNTNNNNTTNNNKSQY